MHCAGRRHRDLERSPELLGSDIVPKNFHKPRESNVPEIIWISPRKLYEPGLRSSNHLFSSVLYHRFASNFKLRKGCIDRSWGKGWIYDANTISYMYDCILFHLHTACIFCLTAAIYIRHCPHSSYWVWIVDEQPLVHQITRENQFQAAKWRQNGELTTTLAIL